MQINWRGLCSLVLGDAMQEETRNLAGVVSLRQAGSKSCKTEVICRTNDSLRHLAHKRNYQK